MTHEHCKGIKLKIKVSIQIYYCKLLNMYKFAHDKKTQHKKVNCLMVFYVELLLVGCNLESLKWLS